MFCHAGSVVWPVGQCSVITSQRVCSAIHAAAGGNGAVKGRAERRVALVTSARKTGIRAHRQEPQGKRLHVTCA
jgi:hypothetical protein